MADTVWRDGPWELLIDLKRLVADRAPAEVRVAETLDSQLKASERGYQRVREGLIDRHRQEKEAIAEERAAAEAAIQAQFEAEQSGAQHECDADRHEIMGRYQGEESAAREKLQENRWQAGAMSEGARTSLSTRHAELQTQLDARWNEFRAIQDEAVRLLRRCWQWRQYAQPQPRGIGKNDPLQHFHDSLPLAQQQLRRLTALQAPRLFQGFWPVILIVLLWVAIATPCIVWLKWDNWYWVALSLVFTAILGGGVGHILYDSARESCTQGYLLLLQILADADESRLAAREALRANYERKIAAMNEQRHGEVEKAEDECSTIVAEIHGRRQAELDANDAKHASVVTAVFARRERLMAEVQQRFAQRLDDANGREQAALARLERKSRHKAVAIQNRYQEAWDAMAERWRSGVQRFQTSVEELNRTCRQGFLDWNAPDWGNWTPAAQIPTAVPFGRFNVKLAQLENGIPTDERLKPEQVEFSMPAMFPSRNRSLLLLKATGEGLPKAVEGIQSVMLRLLTSLPPGKVRFMIIDPVGLGENFSAFMHLTDYNEQLVSSRIWTDSSHIEQRLTELTGHMENVIQVYLRNEFQSIEEYNQFAGDLAEPYRVLVVANFPAAFSDSAAARLASIVASGTRCGVYTVLSVDSRMRMPRDFHLADLDRQAVVLSWNDGQFSWENPDFGKLPLEFPPPPPAEQFTQIVRTVGHAAKDADRVEVPFDCVVPDSQQWWTTQSSGGVEVPLGRAGAMKLQCLRLGRGTSQHVLIAGKTGSGKSTLLHALITNVALRYSPDEIELYLIDFKKGVEFKAYAQWELPHARVIAIESEREFGLSVLERLDLELKQRGDLFRSLGVQDIHSFRDSRPDVRMPRILLIVDEFQELFVEDDRLAQGASLLLDRLVRQGRAFGVHVLLGSQTLAGSYSLPRSTIGQMAVRIALQCSEADAHLILSEENTAARLLTRPGEAIYNDANGLYEGNHPFQVVWLSEDQRELYLQRVQQLARSHSYPVRPAIVFEGNVAADAGKNPLLTDLLSAPAWPEKVSLAHAWLGSAVAIKDPTSVQFQRQSGANLLLVGHQEDEALGILATCAVSLAAQHAPAGCNGQPEGARFYVLDGSRIDTRVYGFWNRVVGILPHQPRLEPIRGAAAVIREIAEELTRREQPGCEEGPPVFLFIYDLARFRDLRRNEDDYSYSRSEEAVSPPAQFVKILREGPALGIHTLMWCDTYSNVNRTLDRAAMREIEMRVLFQMSSNDSSNLVDSPAAAQLGVHRAVLYNESEGRLEKFRPYGLPADDWLSQIADHFRRRLASSGTPPA